MERIQRIAGKTPGVSHTVAIAGQSILLNANAANFGAMYLMLDDFRERLRPDLSGDAIADRLREAFRDEIRDGLINIFAAAPVEGLGTAGGFKIVIEDRGDNGPRALDEAAHRAVENGNADPALRGSYTSFRATTPWLYLDLDRQAAKTMGVSVADVFNTLQVFFGSLYVNDFNRFGRTWQVTVQASPEFRKQVEDLKLLKVRNDRGGMVPLGAISSVREVTGPVMVIRYNMYPSAFVNGDAAAGTSSGEAIERLETAAAKELPPTMRTDWTELALLQLQAGNNRHARLPAGGRARLPGPRRAIRELVATAGGVAVSP